MDLQGHSKSVDYIATEIVDCNLDGEIDDGDLLCTFNEITYQFNAIRSKYNNLIERVDQHNTHMNELVTKGK